MDKWQEYVKALADSEIEFPHLKTAILAQSIIECGRGSTKLFQEHNNPRGIHYWDFLAKWATPVRYETDTEPDGWGIFCKFATMKDAVDSYFAWFDHWEDRYGDWRQYAKKTATDFLSWIGPRYCPPGYKPEWAAKHGGLNYHQYIMQNLYDEAEKLLMKVGPATPTELKVTWFEFNRAEDGKSVLVGYDGDKAKFVMRNNSVEVLIKTMQKFPDAKTFLVAPAGKAIPGVEDEPKPEPKPTTSKLINLDIGHSINNPGARSRAGADEYTLNKLQYNVIKEIVEKAGHRTKCYDPANDNLTAVGQFAKGSDMSIHLHHNAYDGNEDPGTEVLYDNDKAEGQSIKFAKIVSAAMAKALGTKDRGAKPFGGTVMDVAEQQGTFPVILTEAYFLNPYDPTEAQKRSIIAAKAIAQCILDWFA
jgi:N-acetylmuramoyl-L-alanine amidase